jgi:TIR domain
MQVFISYEYIKNQDQITRLAEQLRRNGISPATLDLQLTLSDKLYTHLDQALKHCDYAIAVLTKDYVNSKWLQKELNALHYKDQLMRNEFLLPILLEDCVLPQYIDEERVLNLVGVPDEEMFGRIRPFFSKTRQVFVVMKIADPNLDSTYKVAIKPAVEESGFIPLRIDEVQNADPITSQILSEIRKSGVILIDLTGRSPNCYYETGYAHALEKEIILCIKEGEKIDFDLSVHKFIIWKTDAELKEALRTRLSAIKLKVELLTEAIKR